METDQVNYKTFTDTHLLLFVRVSEYWTTGDTFRASIILTTFRFRLG